MQRWFDRMGEAVERHGGTIEDYRGDGVMAVFGIPVAHEDDALRAARAALDMRERPAARSARRAGCSCASGSGSTPARPRPAAARTAARSRPATRSTSRRGWSRPRPPARSCSARDTYRLVEHAVEAEAIEPLTVKGKRAAIDAYRLLGVAAHRPDAAAARRARRWSTATTSGRASWPPSSARAARACELCAVVGSPGVGKSRLVAELAETFSDRRDGGQRPLPAVRRDAHVVAAVGGARRERAAGRARRRRAPGDPARGRAAGAQGDPVAPDEAQWALRVVIERLARRQPLVLAVDDLQWADPPLLDLLDHLAEAVRDAPLLLLGTARPELFDERPGLARERRPVAPAARRARGRLLHRLAGATPIAADARNRILEVAEGNPLFVVELVAMAEDGGEALTDVALPPTIQALLAARLDRLDGGRARGARGRRRRGQGVRARARARARPRRARSTRRWTSWCAKGWSSRPATRFRFHHQLIRDAAYEGTSKRARADLHARLARTSCERARRWSATTASARCCCGASSASTTPPRRGLAAASLAAAARRAAQREDAAAAVALLRRALALVARRRHAAARARRRAVRGGPDGRRRSGPSTPRSRAPPTCAGRRARASSASSCAWRARRPPGSSARCTWPTRR